jgi:hypothetical protein
MAPSRAEWTYELPPVTGDSVWLEEYLVYDRSGEPAGKVFAVLEHDGRRWLGIERDHLPGWSDRRAVPFEAIRETDHENLAVHLGLSAEEIENALELDPKAGFEQGGAARRITDVPPAELPRQRDAGAPGPVDRVTVLLAPLAAVVGMLALLAVFIFWGAGNSSAALPYFAVPGLLFALSAFLGYRALSRPWTQSGAAQRHPPQR